MPKKNKSSKPFLRPMESYIRPNKHNTVGSVNFDLDGNTTTPVSDAEIEDIQRNFDELNGFTSKNKTKKATVIKKNNNSKIDEISRKIYVIYAKANKMEAKEIAAIGCLIKLCTWQEIEKIIAHKELNWISATSVLIAAHKLNKINWKSFNLKGNNDNYTTLKLESIFELDPSLTLLSNLLQYGSPGLVCEESVLRRCVPDKNNDVTCYNILKMLDNIERPLQINIHHFLYENIKTLEALNEKTHNIKFIIPTLHKILNKAIHPDPERSITSSYVDWLSTHINSKTPFWQEVKLCSPIGKIFLDACQERSKWINPVGLMNIIQRLSSIGDMSMGFNPYGLMLCP